MNRRIRIAVALDGEGYWIARGHSEAADEELALAAADDLADVAETYILNVELPGPAEAPGGSRRLGSARKPPRRRTPAS